MKTETCKLYSRDFWIFLPKIIKIDLYNSELYRFKVGAFFETQCSTFIAVMSKAKTSRPRPELRGRDQFLEIEAKAEAKNNYEKYQIMINNIRFKIIAGKN